MIWLRETARCIGVTLGWVYVIGCLSIMAAVVVDAWRERAKRRHEAEYRKWLEEARLGGYR